MAAAAALAVVASITTPAPAQFSPVSLAVLRVDTTGSTASRPGSIVEFDKVTGTPTGYTVPLAAPAAANGTGITFHDSQSNTLQLHRSTDGTTLNAFGYAAPAGTASVTASQSTVINRVVAAAATGGTASYQRPTDGSFNTTTLRGVVPTGPSYYLIGSSTGAGGGVRYANKPAARPP